MTFGTLRTFETLLRREWMQHHRGWFWLMVVPLALLLLAVTFGQVQVGAHDPALRLLALSFVGCALLCVVLALAAVALQAPGLARRDVQDRSIEFWLSLPVGHGQALSATVLMHFWIFPLMALGAGLVGGLVLAPLVVLRGYGGEALAALPWGQVAALLPLAVARLAVGLALGMVWMAPLLMAGMAAAAWLKGWGVPALAAVVGLGGALLRELYGQEWLLAAVSGLFERGAAAIFPGLRPGSTVDETALIDQADVAALAHAVGQDLLDMLNDLASPWLLLDLALVAASLALLWLRRSRVA